jgi:hypothetical protein
MTAYSRKRAVAVHEAGHTVTAYLHGCKFKSVSLGDGRRHGSFAPAPARGCFTPEVLERRGMVLLAGSEAERVWCARAPGAPGAPADWLERATAGRGRDLQSARVLAEYACAGDVSLCKSWLGHIRGQVLGLTGRGSGDCGDERFWQLTSALADALRSSWILRGKEATRVLDRAA